MTRYSYTKSEMEAHMLFTRGMSMITSSEPNEINKSADAIIELAERIKRERDQQTRFNLDQLVDK
jgi:hypothetical protein